MTGTPAPGRSEVAGLDALETPLVRGRPLWRRFWSSLWPKALAIAIALIAWELVVLSGRWPTYVLPAPTDVLGRLASDVGTPELWTAIVVTLRRAIWGFGIAVVIGVGIGVLVSRFAVMRSAVGSLIMGLQTMPSIAWFPLAVLLFKLTEEAITFVVVLGAAPSIANGLIHGVDHIPPVLTRAGRVMGAKGLDAYRYIILPAAMPSFVAGLKQGWAFAWRSLMAGELIVVIANKTSLGQLLSGQPRPRRQRGPARDHARDPDRSGSCSTRWCSGTIERRIRAKRGLLTN